MTLEEEEGVYKLLPANMADDITLHPSHHVTLRHVMLRYITSVTITQLQVR